MSGDRRRTDSPTRTELFTVCHATGAELAKAKALLEELSASHIGIDAAALDDRCVYVILWGRGAESLSHLSAGLSEVDWPELVHIVGDPTLRSAHRDTVRCGVSVGTRDQRLRDAFGGGLSVR